VVWGRDCLIILEQLNLHIIKTHLLNHQDTSTIMLGPMNVMNPPQQEVTIEPLKEVEQTRKSTSLSKFMKSVSKKRPRNLFRNSSYRSQSSTNTAATDMTERTDVGDVERTVRFAAKPAAVHFTLSRDDYSTEELRASWFQQEEYARITKDCCKQVRKMEEGEIFKDKKYCSRGLEAHTRLRSITKSANRKLAFSAVLDEQEEQRQLGVVDDDTIGQLYNRVSSSCQLWATTLGLRDQREAERYLD
jgi:hypothetical protein